MEKIIKLIGINENEPTNKAAAQEKPESNAIADRATKGNEKAAKDKHTTIKIIFSRIPGFQSLLLLGLIFSYIFFSNSFE
jgi:hypothetical protein